MVFPLFHCNYYCLLSVYAPHTGRYPPRLEDAGLPGIGVTVGSESTDMGAKNKIRVLLNDLSSPF